MIRRPLHCLKSPESRFPPLLLSLSLFMAAATHRLRLWWRSRGADSRVVLVCGLAIVTLFFALGPWIRGIQIGDSSDSLGQAGDDFVPVRILFNAQKKGAVCLDGSPPGLHFDRGSGTGVDSWVIHLEGGGWCSSVESCSSRKVTAYGSSSLMESLFFEGILSRNRSENPDFYNWNRVKVRYCDGGSFSGNVERDVHDGEKLFFRGQRIWEAVMDDLMASGLATARQALLIGCSAGGLATFIHCDDFRAHLSGNTVVKCLVDGGFFLDAKDISGSRTIRSFYHDVVQLHGIAGNLPKDCTERIEPSQCFFPQELIKSIRSPLFILNPTYDYWQIQHILAPERSDPDGLWTKCKKDILDCHSNQTETLRDFRGMMIDTLKDFRERKDGGVFLNSCYIHCQTLSNLTWHSSTSPRINDKTIARAVGEWYFDNAVSDAVDCPFPCNPTCYNMRFP